MSDYIISRIEQADRLLKEGHLLSAHFALKKVLRRQPDNVNALILNAELQLQNGKQLSSTDIIKKLFEMNPVSFDSAMQKRLGVICYQNDLLFMATQLFDCLRENEGHDEMSLYYSGLCLRRLGKMKGAERDFLECLALKPDVAAPYLQLGHVFKALGDTDRAASQYKKYIALAPNDEGTGYWCLADLKSYVFSDDEITLMKHKLVARQDDPPQASALNFALGWVAENSRSFSEAMQYYNQGNSIQAELKPFHTEQYRRIISGLQDVPAGKVSLRSNETPIAILIVGLPRSGTTLIEQILSSHSRVQATDELPFLEKIALSLAIDGGYPERLRTISRDECKQLRQQYVDGARNYLKRDSDFFIDKYPGNFLHIGLIKRIMPESIIIDARRDPRDVAISAYRQLFNVRNEFASSFDDIYEYYKGYLALTEHWQSEYPDQIMTLNYENLVSSPEEGIGDLLDFCGLEQQSACFKFYEQERTVMTPSVNQVSKPMFTSSIGRWRSFEPFAHDDMARLGSLLRLDRGGSANQPSPDHHRRA